jgi:hypothetical protein
MQSAGREVLLADERSGATRTDAARRIGPFVGRHQEDHDPRIHGREPAGRLDAVHLRHADVEQHQVGAESPGSGYALLARGGLTDEAKPLGCGDELAGGLEKPGRVVDCQ